MTLNEQLEMLRLKVMRTITEMRLDDEPLERFPSLRGDDWAELGTVACLMLVDHLGYAVQTSDDEGCKGAAGWCDVFKRRIYIRPTRHRNEITRVALHEAAHAWDYETSGLNMLVEDGNRAEIIAESAAWLTARHFGFDMSEHSLPYLACCCVGPKAASWGRRGTDALRDPYLEQRTLRVTARMIAETQPYMDALQPLAA